MIGACIKSVVICQHRVDFRKGMNSLLAEAYQLELNPYEGDCVVFINKKRDTIKCIFGDKRGLYLCMRRFDALEAKLPFDFMTDPCFVEITTAELSMFLEGFSFSTLHQVPSCQIA